MAVGGRPSAGFAVVAFCRPGSAHERVATLSGTFAGFQTAQRVEAFAFATLLARTEGEADCTLESQYVNTLQPSLGPSKFCADIFMS